MCVFVCMYVCMYVRMILRMIVEATTTWFGPWNMRRVSKMCVYVCMYVCTYGCDHDRRSDDEFVRPLEHEEGE